MNKILNVYIIDNETGEILADIDAKSTADALAYYLTSRRIDETATEASITRSATVPGERLAPTATIHAQERGIGTGNLLWSIFTRIH